MNHNHNHDCARSDDQQLVPVRFEFTHPTAVTVYVAGTFNRWQPLGALSISSSDVHVMGKFNHRQSEARTPHSSSAGNWWKETALAPGTYEYCLVVDGQWILDPLAMESVANPFGGRNSILKVAGSPAADHLADA
jgi:hypothetical protein